MIVSGCGSPAASLSICLDHYLRPLVQQIPSCITSVTRFLRILKTTGGHIPSGSVLVAFGVASLCTGVPHAWGHRVLSRRLEGILSWHVAFALAARGGHPRLRCRGDYFLFDGGFYLRIRGAAVGAPRAPSCAGIFMGDLEAHVVSTAPGDRAPFLWRRCVGNIYVVLTHSLG